MIKIRQMWIALLFVASYVESSSISLSQLKDFETCTTPECNTAADEISKNLDLSADPCNDFYRFACGSWMDNNEIPPSMSRWGRFNQLNEEVTKDVTEILNSPIDPSGSRAVGWAKKMYIACNNMESLDSEGKKYFESALKDFPMLVGKDWNENNFDLESSLAMHSGIIYSMEVQPDAQDTTKNVVYLDQAGRLGLVRDMLVEPQTFDTYIKAYKTYMKESVKYLNTFIGALINEDFLIQSIDNVLAFEMKLANIMMSSEDRKNTTALYNPMTLTEIMTKYPKIKWYNFFKHAFADVFVDITLDERIIVFTPKFFEDLNQLLSDTPKRIIADYIYWIGIIYSFAPEGPKDLVDISFKFYSIYAGIKVPPTREHYCTSKLSAPFVGMAGMGFAISHEYLKTHFSDEAKKNVDDMVITLRATFKKLVTESVWMDVETQNKANEKVDAMLQHIAYPDWLKDKNLVDKYYERLVEPKIDTHINNILNVRRAESEQEKAQLRLKPERDTWISHSAVVNAFYSPIKNSITFPAGILHSPFFAIGGPRYINFGAIGAVIGHEITHGFDNSGRQFDKYGNAIPWWSSETIETFQKQAQCYVDQYNSYHVPEVESVLGYENAHVDGQKTLGENIADNGGIHQAFAAYGKSVEMYGSEGRLPGLLNYSPEQLFFISYSQVWCIKTTKSALLNQILSDPHSPGQFRVWGPLSNSPDFVKAFNCPVGSNMNRGDDKCVLW